jgi:hypothetical protein
MAPLERHPPVRFGVYGFVVFGAGKCAALGIELDLDLFRTRG